MNTPSGTDPKLTEEISVLKQRIKELEQSETDHKQVEEALRTSEAKFKTIFETIEDIYYEADSEGIITVLSPSVRRLTGWHEEDLIGRPATEVYVDPNGREQLLSILLKKGYVHDYELLLKRKDGKEWQTSLSAHLVMDDNGRPIGVRGLLRDITERKRVERELEISRNRLSRAEIISRCGNWEFDLESKRVLASDGARRIYGSLDREWTIPEVQEIPLPEYRNMLNTALRALVNENLPYNVEFKIRRSDTGEIVDIHSVAEYDRHRNVVFGIIQDITERKRMEDTLRDAEMRYRLLFEHSPDGILIIDTASVRPLEFNETAHRQLGYSREEFSGLSIFDLEAFETPEETRQRIALVIRGGRADFETRHRTKKGDIRNIHVTAQSTEILGQSVYHCIWRDITERKQAEEKMREGEAFLHVLLETIPIPVFYKDRDGRYLLTNKAFETFFGKSKEQLLGKNVFDISPPEMAKVYHAKDAELFDKPGVQVYETQVWDAHGVLRDVIFDKALLTDGQGSVTGLIGSVRDITEHKRAVEELKQREKTLDAFFNAVHESVLLINREGTVLLSNLTVAQRLGKTIQELVGTYVYDHFPPDVVRYRKEQYDKVITTGESIYFQDIMSGKSFDQYAYPVFDEEGKVMGVAIFAHDITSRKQAEEEILREKDKLKILSDNAPFGMVLIDREGHFTYINRKFSELFGYDLCDIPDIATWRRMAYPDAGYRQTVNSAWGEDLGDTKAGEQKSIFTVTCKDGTKKTVQFITSILMSGDYLMTCEDITEMRQLENQLRQAQKTEAIGTLAGGIAHDFNNILTALMGYAALIQMKMDITDPLRPYVDEVLTASEKAVDLTQSLLAFSRQQSVTLVPLNMNTTIKVAEKLLRRLLTEDIEFHTTLGTGDMIVMADKSQMDQILFNLVTNARDAMPKGGRLTLTTALTVIDATFTKVHGFGETGDYVRISIVDTGEGMDEMTRQKIFDPFFTTKEIGKGTGLGLATVYGIIKQHNGYITVESAVGQGTTFHVYLPHIKMKVDTLEERTVPLTGGKETILIAEDNAGVRRFMREALQGQGYTIREAVDGEDAIEQFRKHRDIDLIIIDSVMPKKNGRETYEEIHRIDPRIKALFTSGYTKDIVLDKGIEEKDFDFIAKPLSLNALFQKVREVLDG